MSKYTKGPWYFDSGNMQVETANTDRFVVCDLPTKVTGDLNGRQPGTDPWADGDLLAAAPEMLEALKNLTAALVSGPEHVDECFKDAQKAIVKAEGEL